MKKLLFSLLFTTFSIAALAQNCSDILYQGYVPKVKGQTTFICKGGFGVVYDPLKKRPIVSLEKMNPQTIKMSILPRKDNFRPEPSINPAMQPSLKAFVGTGYDKGHLVSAEDMSFDPDFVNDTYVLINIVPELEEHNRGIWKSLEMKTRKLAITDEIFVASGPIYPTIPELLSDGTPIPTSLFKIIIRPSTGESFCFNIPHTTGLSSKDLNKYSCKIKDIILKTNILRVVPLSSKLIEKSGL